MLVIVWEFRVKPEARAAFELAYGPSGDWVRLFRVAKGYAGTELVRDSSGAGRYLTLDRWQSIADFEAFRQQFAREYEEIDLRCTNLTESETKIGVFDAL